jgi:hypothetical protein
MPQCKITQDGNELVLSFPYNAAMVADLKSSLPASSRKYDPDRKSWRVAPTSAAKIQNLCHKYFGELPFVPDVVQAKPVIKSTIISVRYIGATKDRGGDERSAYGYVNGGWNAVFSEQVLRNWFDGTQVSPEDAPTLYSVLGVKRDADDAQIKTGYRRMVMQWHPDKCHEPNAQDQFMRVQEAYTILSTRRARYDAGLALEASMTKPKSTSFNPLSDGFRSSLQDGFRSPLRCGYILCEGVEMLGVLNVSKIMAWEDIRDGNGRTLVVSWPRDAKMFTEEWV